MMFNPFGVDPRLCGWPSKRDGYAASWGNVSSQILKSDAACRVAFSPVTPTMSTKPPTQACLLRRRIPFRPASQTVGRKRGSKAEATVGRRSKAHLWGLPTDILLEGLAVAGDLAAGLEYASDAMISKLAKDRLKSGGRSFS